MKLFCGMQARNEARMLPGSLAHLRGYVDGFVVLDDGSTDETGEILRAEPKMKAVITNPARDAHVWDEPRNRQRVLHAAKELGADWIYVCDPDERSEKLLLRTLKIHAFRAGERGSFAIGRRHLWEKLDVFRTDPPWDVEWRRSLFSLRAPLTFSRHQRLHGPWAPDSAYEDPAKKVDLFTYHLGLIRREDRVACREKYRRIDPRAEHLPGGYDYLVDERTLRLETIREDRGYDVASLPADLRALR